MLMGKDSFPSVALLAAVEDAQDHQTLTIEAVLRNVRHIEDLQHKLAILPVSGNWPTQSRVFREHLCLGNNLMRHGLSELRMLLLEKRRKSDRDR